MIECGENCRHVNARSPPNLMHPLHRLPRHEATPPNHVCICTSSTLHTPPSSSQCPAPPITLKHRETLHWHEIREPIHVPIRECSCHLAVNTLKLHQGQDQQAQLGTDTAKAPTRKSTRNKGKKVVR